MRVIGRIWWAGARSASLAHPTDLLTTHHSPLAKPPRAELTVGLLNLASQLARSLHKSSATGGRRSVERICRFEELEPRIALSATPGPALTVGATYYEQSSPESAGDRFEVAWVGGAPNTQL